MTRENKSTIILSLIVCGIAAILGVLNKSYLVSGMYIGTVILASIIMREKEIYDQLYAILLISLCYDYVLHVPGIESVYMFHIVLAIFTLMSLYKFFREHEVWENINKVILCIFVIWFIYMCISVTWALNKSLAVKYIAIYIMMFAFIVDLMIYNINRKRLETTIKVVLGIISLTVLVGFVEVLLGHQLPVKHYADSFENLSQLHRNMINARPIAFSFNTNNLAATLAILSPLCFYAIYKFENIILKVWFIIVSIAAFGLIVVTTSRTGSFAFIFGFIVYIIYSICSIRRLGVKQIIFPLILIGGFYIAYNYSGYLVKVAPVDGEKVENITLSDKIHALEEMQFEEGGEGSVNVRGTIIKDVLVEGLIHNKNYLGYGVGNVEQYVRDQGNTGTVFSPHCYPIEILADFGVPGVILYGVYYLYLLISNIVIGIQKKSVMCFAAVSGLIAFAPASFGPSSITYVFSYWLLIAFSIACIQVYRKEDTGSFNRTTFKEFRFY
ncbi:putative membrane protein [Clostridium neonatale]|uniref:O-antigen ligase family protein n=1 Tax=Clostridium neonatale TaxID=137838 RepID=UPI002588E72F|nr:O-antigen ligase family protein [Clostridium neonatale]CAI3625448.1 putative membrane protein [Clostridium neonatale]